MALERRGGGGGSGSGGGVTHAAHWLLVQMDSEASLVPPSWATVRIASCSHDEELGDPPEVPSGFRDRLAHVTPPNRWTNFLIGCSNPRASNAGEFWTEPS